MSIENMVFCINPTDVSNEALVSVVDNEKFLFNDYPISDYGTDNVFLNVKSEKDREHAHRMLDRWLDAIAAQR